jgi:1,4-dihydroxy-6-naphthoate synthase
MPVINIGFSPCPNDTFIFDAMVHGKIDTEGLEFSYFMKDVETLNHLAMKGGVEMVKVSYHAWLYLMNNYALLDSGSALGSGNGPLLIAKKHYSAEELRGLTIAIPGEYTTAHLLLKLAMPEAGIKKIMIFSRIEDAILNHEADAGVIIHENRFTYEKKGLVKILDLGEYWEGLTHLPIPLGGIIAKKSLGFETIHKLDRIMRRSVEHAMKDPAGAMEFVRCNAQEMDEEVMMKHIRLYVNQFTIGLGNEGKKAIQILVEKHNDFFARG